MRSVSVGTKTDLLWELSPKEVNKRITKSLQVNVSTKLSSGFIQRIILIHTEGLSARFLIVVCKKVLF